MSTLKDRSSDIVHLAARILEAADSALDKSDSYLRDSDVRPEIASELLVILNGADDLLELFDPSPHAGEYFGMPREATSGSDVPELEFRNADGWDFRPWYSEKALSIKNGVKSAITYWEKDITEVKLSANAPMSPREWVRNGFFAGLRSARRGSKTIFEQTFDDNISALEEE